MDDSLALLDRKRYRAQTFLRYENKRHKKYYLDVNNYIFPSQGEYRKQAIIRWKRKRVKCEILRRNIERSSNKINTCLGTLDETSNNRKDSSNKKRGRDLLQLIPFTADILPDVRDCRYCGAVKFYSETSSFCCLDGCVVLSNNPLPLIMKKLLTSTSEEAKSFRTCIRTYNNIFAFTSFAVRADKDLARRNKGIYTFRVQGQVYHFINSLLPDKSGAKNLQLYFFDTDNELQNRLTSCPQLSEPLIAKCIQCLEQNPYARFFRNLRDIPKLDEYKIVLKTLFGQDQRIYNKPEVSQVAAILVDGEESGEHGERNIEVKTHSSRSKSIEYYYGCYDPLQYPLMFPLGELGWHQHIPKKSSIEKNKRGSLPCAAEKLISPGNIINADDLLDMENKVLAKNADNSKYLSIREYYAYKLQIRRHDKSYLLHFGRLLQQYIVDNYVRLETQRLAFYKTQQEIRQEFLQGVVDAMASGETEGSTIGRRVVLPTDFIGGPRNMRRKYMDAMALVQKFGKPDIFLTLTCNPNWPEIKEHLMRHEEAQNRADLVVRVFHAKLEQFKHELLKKNVLGDVAAYTYVIEFQKRGLPHAHFLLILRSHSKMYHSEEYDALVLAEIPSESSNPHLFNMVVKHMFHGPCGNLNQDNVCMKNGICKNLYPKAFCDETFQSGDAYPTYKR